MVGSSVAVRSFHELSQEGLISTENALPRFQSMLVLVVRAISRIHSLSEGSVAFSNVVGHLDVGVVTQNSIQNFSYRAL